MNTSDYKSFSYLENGDIIFSQFETIKSVKKLDSGTYNINYIGYPKYEVTLNQVSSIESIKIYQFEDKKRLDDLFESFFNPTNLEKITSLGFCHKVGVLFHGIEGTGKSSIIRHYCDYAIKNHNALVFHMQYRGYEISDCWKFLQKIREIQDNPIIIIFDEMDSNMDKIESLLKTFLDGNDSINNSIVLGATNYIDKIPKALKERPSRFKYSIEVGGIEIVEDIISIVTPLLDDLLTEIEISQIAGELKGQTLDCIKQFCTDKIMDINHYGKKVSQKIGFINT